MHKDFTNYSPDAEQKQNLRHLSDLVKICEKNNIKVSIVGGYGYDGLLGYLTRDHNDIDVLVKDDVREKLKDVLKELGYVFYKEDPIKEIYKKESGFSIDVAKQRRLDDYLSIGENYIFPSKNNAMLYDLEFTTPELEGFEHIQRLQNELALEKGWSNYKHSEHLKQIVKLLKAKKH